MVSLNALIRMTSHLKVYAGQQGTIICRTDHPAVAQAGLGPLQVDDLRKRDEMSNLSTNSGAMQSQQQNSTFIIPCVVVELLLSLSTKSY